MAPEIPEKDTGDKSQEWLCGVLGKQDMPGSRREMKADCSMGRSGFRFSKTSLRQSC